MKFSNLFSTAAVLTCLIATGAQAGAVNYGGNNCVARSGTVSLDYDGALYNPSSTTSSWVLCDVAHTDFDGFLNPGEIDSGWVHFVDLNRSRDASCRFRGHSLNSNGTITRYYSNLPSTSGYGTHRQVLSLGSMSENGASDMKLACEMPTRDLATGYTKMHVYRVNQ